MPRTPIPARNVPDYLEQRWGLRRGRRRLAELRASGAGPVFHRTGNDVLYFPDDIDAWAEQLIGDPVRSTTEESARRLIGTGAVPTPAHT